MKENNEKEIQDMIQFYEGKNIPNPEQYPIQFKFLVDSYKHYMKMKRTSNLPNVK